MDRVVEPTGTSRVIYLTVPEAYLRLLRYPEGIPLAHLFEERKEAPQGSAGPADFIPR